MRFRLDQINKDEWFNWQQPAKPIYLGGCFEAVGKRFEEIFCFDFFTSLIFFRPQHDNKSIQLGSWILRLNEGRQCGANLVRVLMNDGFRKDICAEFDDRASTLLKNACDVQESISENRFDSFCDLMETFFESYIDFYAIGCITEPVQWRVEEILFTGSKYRYTSEISEKFSDEEIKAAVFCTKKHPYIYDIEESLERVFLSKSVDARTEDNEFDEELIDEHIRRFHWSRNNYAGTSILSRDSVLEELTSGNTDLVVRLEKYRSTREKNLEVLNSILNDSSDYVRNVIKIGDVCGSGMADRRKQVILQVVETILLAAGFASSRTGVDLSKIEQLTATEFSNFLRKPDDYSERLNRRLGGFLLVESRFPIDERDFDLWREYQQPRERITPPATQIEFEFYEGDDAHAALIRYNQIVDIVSQRGEGAIEVTGDVAYRDGNDRISGIAYVVVDPKHDDFADGAILVASSTTPDFMHLIKRAAAIVTDQSGMATHAALTSRELQIPCIVGTAIGSAVLTTGERLELDFETGNCKRINE